MGPACQRQPRQHLMPSSSERAPQAECSDLFAPLSPQPPPGLAHQGVPQRSWIPKAWGGQDLLGGLRLQLAHFDGDVLPLRATAITRHPEMGFMVSTEENQWHASRVLLTTGVSDHQAQFPGIDKIRDRGLLRECPICVRHEFNHQRIGVIGSSEHAAREALFLRHYSEKICLFGMTPHEVCEPDLAAHLANCGVSWLAARTQHVDHGEGRVPVRAHERRRRGGLRRAVVGHGLPARISTWGKTGRCLRCPWPWAPGDRCPMSDHRAGPICSWRCDTWAAGWTRSLWPWETARLPPRPFTTVCASRWDPRREEPHPKRPGVKKGPEAL